MGCNMFWDTQITETKCLQTNIGETIEKYPYITEWTAASVITDRTTCFNSDNSIKKTKIKIVKKSI